MKNRENKEREKVRFRIKNYYLVLQLCYSVILYLESRCSTITNFFAIVRFCKTGYWGF